MKALFKRRPLHNKENDKSRYNDVKIAELQIRYEEKNSFNHERKGSHGLPEIKTKLNLSKEPLTQKRRNSKIPPSIGKLKNVENIVEISIENFKNKLFLRKEEKFEEAFENEFPTNKLFAPESKLKKSKFLDKKSHMKIESPVLWLKSQREYMNNIKKLNLKEAEQNTDLIIINSKFKKTDEWVHMNEDNSKNEETSNFKNLNKLSQFDLDIRHVKNEDDTNLALSKDFVNNIQISPIKNKNYSDTSNKINSSKYWKLGEKIAEGSSSCLYKAFNFFNGNTFVVKKFHSIKDDKLSKVFYNEINILSQINHPNIINLLGSETTEEHFHIFLEYMPGGSLASILQKYGPLQENVIRKYLRQLLEGLLYLHSKGIIHRDIKAANILITSEGTIKLSDFGASGKIELDNENDLLKSLKGTIPWMAPEVICQNSYGCKADVWSVGCLLIELKTGRVPWDKFDNFIQALLKIGKTDSMPTIPEDISDNMKSFLLLCLQRDPLIRPDVNTLLEHPFLN